MIKRPHPTTNFPLIFITSSMLLIIMFIISLSFGAASISPRDVFDALFTQQTNASILIIRELRLPRELAAVTVGASLSVAGAMMQGMTRNPLADPGLLGLSSGAYAALAIAGVFSSSIHYFTLMIYSFLGAFIGGLLTFTITLFRRQKLSPLHLVLAGAAVSAFLFAIAEGVGIHFKQTKQMAMWTAGGLSGTTWTQLELIVPIALLGLVISFLLSRRLTLLSIDETLAIGLGQNTTLTRVFVFVAVVLLTGTAVALVGNMTFIGLMIPHIARKFVGMDYRVILPLSALFGATFMLFADTVSRLLFAPFEVPVVAIVSVFGLPFFLWIVRSKRGVMP